MKKCLNFRIFLSAAVLAFGTYVYAQNSEPVTTIESTSEINWITRDFVSHISMDIEKAKIEMPSGKKTASTRIKTKMPQLIQPPLLSLYTNSNQNLSDMIIEDQLTLDQVYHFIMSGYKTPDVFSNDLKNLKTDNKINITNLSSLLVRHKNEYTPQKPIDLIPSRAYSGIIIDARGSFQVHGEYIRDNVYPCLFPMIWDEQMNVVFEKNLANPEIVKSTGLNVYHYSDDASLYKDRIGSDPLYIKAVKVFGRNRTDPVISHNDALKILTIPENVKLLQQGKVVILLDKENLIYKVASPKKDNAYYIKLNEAKQYLFNNPMPGVEISNSEPGIKFTADLKFYPDSPELLPSEKKRVEYIANQLKNILQTAGYTVLVEGHTADLGKPTGQLNLSIERAASIRNALIGEGIDSKLISYKGYGALQPAAPNDTEQGRAQNRRVEIIARPTTTYIQRDWN